MFTGIIEETGIVKKINKSGKTLALTIKADLIMCDIHLGDSIAVNGVCLTVTSFDKNLFTMDVMPETFQATTLKLLKEGSFVNLERAMSANGRFGGHFVTGHVDGVGKIRAKKPIENSIFFEVEIPIEFSHLVMEKGSITVDGTSLTIFNCDEHSLSVSIIPHTAHLSIIGNKNIGDLVNIEFDMMAKYFFSFTQKKETKMATKITADFLKNNGFY